MPPTLRSAQAQATKLADSFSPTKRATTASPAYKAAIHKELKTEVTEAIRDKRLVHCEPGIGIHDYPYPRDDTTGQPVMVDIPTLEKYRREHKYRFPSCLHAYESGVDVQSFSESLQKLLFTEKETYLGPLSDMSSLTTISSASLPSTSASGGATPAQTTPARATPSTPARATPSTPARATPSTPARATPSTPARATPSTPARATPSTSARATPSTSARATPSTSAQATPSTSARATPSTSARATPSTSARATPSTSARATPSTSARATPTSAWATPLSAWATPSPVHATPTPVRAKPSLARALDTALAMSARPMPDQVSSPSPPPPSQPGSSKKSLGKRKEHDFAPLFPTQPAPPSKVDPSTRPVKRARWELARREYKTPPSPGSIEFGNYLDILEMIQKANDRLPSSSSAGPSTSTTASGPSTSTTVAGPSMTSTTVAGPSTSTTVAGPSTSTTVAGPSTSTTVAGPLTSTTVAGPSMTTTVAGPANIFTELNTDIFHFKAVESTGSRLRYTSAWKISLQTNGMTESTLQKIVRYCNDYAIMQGLITPKTALLISLNTCLCPSIKPPVFFISGLVYKRMV
ncbi:hypothetical protein FB446DRAFT_700538 [Lentinula raphanica]|nr:hypothetical protein FB446DRAFT_700538 [Lentinula raphanica]